MIDALMREAITLAEQGRWKTAPNPTVGALLVRDGAVVARGWHTAFGKDHAEVECLADAAAKGVNPALCTMVVTLEPCNHYGKTPPCTEAIISAGIRHVVIGLPDPNPQASGGAKRLIDAGVQVEMGICTNECRDLVSDFIVWQTTRRPYVILKLAMTLDGRIATRTGHSRWISSVASRQAVHTLRANVGMAGGSVLIGGNTLYMDNPRLTARIPHVVQQPAAAVITSRIPGSNSLFLLQNRPAETIFLTTTASAATPRAAQLRERGIRIFGLDGWQANTGANLLQALEHLRQKEQCLYVLCEGGGKLALALLDEGLVDEFHLYIAPKIIGDNNATPLFSGRTPLTLDEAISMRFADMQRCGDDVHLLLRAVSLCLQG